MTGNDIVDIKAAAAESDWQRKGFLEKIFTRQEQQYINQATEPGTIVWRLWTMKESAYKIYTRQYGGYFFAPQKFSCTILNHTTGVVKYDVQACHTTTIISKDYIHTIARPAFENDTADAGSCFLLPQTTHTRQQAFIYKKIIDRYHSITGKAKKNLAVIKDENGIPCLQCGSNLQIPVSITHHGRFAAFTIN